MVEYNNDFFIDPVLVGIVLREAREAEPKFGLPAYDREVSAILEVSIDGKMDKDAQWHFDDKYDDRRRIFYDEEKLLEAIEEAVRNNPENPELAASVYRDALGQLHEGMKNIEDLPIVEYPHDFKVSSAGELDNQDVISTMKLSP